MSAPVEELRAADLFNAVQVLHNDPKMPDAYARIVIDWFLFCHDDLSRVGHAADMYKVDPLSLVDEPDSVRHALRFARMINGSTS